VYVDEVQDLTSAELALLVKMSASGILFLAGDPAQSVEEGVAFRFEDVRSVFYELTGRAPTKPLTLTLNFRSHTGILDAAGVLLEWLFDYFPGSCKKLPQDDGLCRGPRPGTHFTGFTGTKVQILTLKGRAQAGPCPSPTGT
jgi:superfamily I DNA/RNA helicase